MPVRNEPIFQARNSKERIREIIDMVARLYVLLMRSGLEINEHEINTMYSILHDLFSQENISWDMQLKQILSENFNLDETLTYLNRNLITLDKMRILLGLIVLADSDEVFSVSEVTKILDVAKKLNIESKNFMEIIEAIEVDKNVPVSISGFKFFSHTNNSIFKDYLILGKGIDCDVLFKNKTVADNEILLFQLDKYIFLGTNNATTATLNEERLKPNSLYLMPESCELVVNKTAFSSEILSKLYKNKDIFDIIEFRKEEYDFRITNNRNNYTIYVNRGNVFLNEKKLPLGKQVPVYFDDNLRIEGFDTFNLCIVVRERQRIGTDIIVPKELFIICENDFYSLSRKDNPSAIIFIEYSGKDFYIYPPRKGWELFINNKKIDEKTHLNINSDTITINRTNFKINSFYELVEIPFDIDEIRVEGLLHYFADGQVALDDFSFSLKKGEMLAIMGQSGSGKSTLLKALAGEIIPGYGSVMLADKNLYQNLTYFSRYIGYVPQEDILFSNLTVYENLSFRATMQMPKLSKQQVDFKVRNILSQMKLTHRSNSLVGNVKNNFLSGGERKRLNISLELLFEPTILICDEPTSGLSSSDSEQILEILKNIANQGKIVMITIHQPNTSLYERFDKVLLMDRGGKMIFYGDAAEAFEYFDAELEQITFGREMILRKRKLLMPEFLFDMIEYPEYKPTGEINYEQIERSLIIKRKYNPDYWHDKFKKKMLYEIIQIKKQKIEQNKNKYHFQRKKLDLFSKLLQLKAFIVRNFLLKIRNKSNVLITFAEAPLLAFIIAFILRLAPQKGGYTYYKNVNMGIFFFISIIVFVFLGLSNSIEEFLSERKNLLREKKLNLRTSYMVVSKFMVLSLFAAIQVILYSLITVVILKIRGAFWIDASYYFLSATIGYSLGLLISAFIHDSKTVINIIPVILIPQIIFGGAVIQYEKMNKDLTLSRDNPIPEIVQIIPSRWLFEGVFTAQAKLNSYNYNLDNLEKERLTIKDSFVKGRLSEDDYWKKVYQIYDQKRETANKYKENLCTNEFVNAAVDMMDGRLLNTKKNVFLSSMKVWGDKRMPTYYFNLIITALYIMLFNIITIIRLRFFYKD